MFAEISLHPAQNLQGNTSSQTEDMLAQLDQRRNDYAKTSIEMFLLVMLVAKSSAIDLLPSGRGRML